MVKINTSVSSKLDGAQLPQGLVTRLGICVKTKMNASFTALDTFCYYVVLLTTAYSGTRSTVHFFLGQFPGMELMLLLLSPLFLIELVIFSVNITLFLTGCISRIYSQLDHLNLILEYILPS